MSNKIAAVLLAATMLTAPAFAAGVANSPKKPTAQTVTSDKVSSAKIVKKHRVHARASHDRNASHAKHAKSKQVKQDKKELTPATTKTPATAATAKAQVKN